MAKSQEVIDKLITLTGHDRWSWEKNRYYATHVPSKSAPAIQGALALICKDGQISTIERQENVRQWFPEAMGIVGGGAVLLDMVSIPENSINLDKLAKQVVMQKVVPERA